MRKQLKSRTIWKKTRENGQTDELISGRVSFTHLPQLGAWHEERSPAAKFNNILS